MGKIYPPEYKDEAVELYRLGHTTYAEVARKLGVSGETVRNWVVQKDRDEGRREDGLTTDERGELTELRRTTRRQAQELEILGKAVGWFAKRTS
jgi:transposase-like protein